MFTERHKPSKVTYEPEILSPAEAAYVWPMAIAQFGKYSDTKTLYMLRKTRNHH